MDRIGIKKSTFYDQKYIAELSIVDEEEYKLLLHQNEKSHLKQLNKLANTLILSNYLLQYHNILEWKIRSVTVDWNS